MIVERSKTSKTFWFFLSLFCCMQKRFRTFRNQASDVNSLSWAVLPLCAVAWLYEDTFLLFTFIFAEQFNQNYHWSVRNFKLIIYPSYLIYKNSVYVRSVTHSVRNTRDPHNNGQRDISCKGAKGHLLILCYFDVMIL